MNAVPMHIRIDPALAATPTLNVLHAGLAPAGMISGPNTTVNLAFRIARLGIPVRLVTTVYVPAADSTWLKRHAKQLVGGELPNIPVVTTAQAEQPLAIGPNDLFVATHWTTAQQLKAVLPRMACQQFFYMLQEFEPGFYGWSSNFALAIETFGLDFCPIINEMSLADYLLGQPLGRLNDPVMRERAVVFEPAVDRAVFHPGAKPAPACPRRLLFYARASNTRNLFGMGLLALRQAAANPAFAGWEFFSVGSRGGIPDLSLGGGRVLRPAPWANYADYGDVLRGGDILLCPMLSPHTSYPVLEMAACGGLSVTNIFATKTRAVLEAISDNIVAAEPTIEGLTAGLLQAARRIEVGHPRIASLNMPQAWGPVLDPVAQTVAANFWQMVAAA